MKWNEIINLNEWFNDLFKKRLIKNVYIKNYFNSILTLEINLHINIIKVLINIK